MSSLPPRQPQSDPHNLSHTGNLQQATKNVNRFAKRDPALYPLSIIVTGILGVAGYFFMTKASEPDATRQLMATGVVNPWDNKNKHDVHPSQTAQFKYRYKTRDGHMEDSHPTMNHTVQSLKDDVAHKYKTNA
ncbi:uncharacterized protein IL334_005711 [Kwoniella shivajii]|uniref:NADH dehydrogenase (Ubiquinone) 1 alpha subcomplex 4 n=1 Tax=Kwoniella shivajii TaxID=564305 RepID=A0ABZ1D4G5_9TREE|nr:hypothetical protein IL334_005711 [Kwoniella shivajii]